MTSSTSPSRLSVVTKLRPILSAAADKKGCCIEECNHRVVFVDEPRSPGWPFLTTCMLHLLNTQTGALSCGLRVIPLARRSHGLIM
jgi:hypothetical protein